MDAAIAQRLIALNQAFYQNLAAPFSATRSQLQPGVLRVLESVPPDANILDLGCGNGGVARKLARRGHLGQYVGMDFSEELLKLAKSNAQSPIYKRPTSHVQFIQSDLTSANWKHQLPIPNPRFDFMFAFAVLHHLPSREVRLGFLRQVRSLMAPDGRFVLSNWQFLNSPRMRERVQPWDEIGLTEGQVDKDDYLLDWRSGGRGLRYIHHFDPAELRELAAETGLQVVDEFLSDGKTGNLALYQIWEPAKL
jgi:SAM-dependent methyltransferase